MHLDVRWFRRSLRARFGTPRARRRVAATSVVTTLSFSLLDSLLGQWGLSSVIAGLICGVALASNELDPRADGGE